MSIKIMIGTKSMIIDNNTLNIITHIDEIEEYLKKEKELTVFLYDDNTTNFHKYEFEYSSNSKLFPRKWILNNILYSLSCDKTRKDMKYLFNRVIILLSDEFEKL